MGVVVTVSMGWIGCPSIAATLLMNVGHFAAAYVTPATMNNGPRLVQQILFILCPPF